VSAGRPPGDQFGEGDFDDEGPRSIFASAWFRALIVVAALAVIGVLALPYILEWVGPVLGGRTVKAPILTTPSPPKEPAAPIPASPPAETPPASPATTPPPAQKSRPAPTAVSESKKPRAEGMKTEEEPKAERAKTARAKAPAPKPKAARPAVAPGGGAYFVQVGAFREERLATALVAKLRAENFPVVETGPGPAGPSNGGIPEPPVAASDRYDVFVSGASSADVNAKLSTEGLSADAVAGGALIKPSLPLRDAVALSKDLANSGFKVQVRRATGGAGPEPAAKPRPAPAGGDAFHRVRVGGFPDRATAEEARKALAAKGYSGFIARSGG
jgi:hypothetical protein